MKKNQISGRETKWCFPLVLALLAFNACDPVDVAPEEALTSRADLTELTLVVVGAYPASAVAEMGGLVAWLNERLAADKLRVGVRVAPTVPQAAAWLMSGEADLYLDSPHPILLARHISGCRPILRRWKYGTPTYNSMIFVRQDSGIQDIDGLRGRTIAFEDRYSSSSFFLPVDLLMANGLEGTFLRQADDQVPADRLGFVFSGGDSNTMHWVLAGKVAAGAMNEWNVESLANDEREQLRALATTDEIPRHLVAVRPDLDPAAEAKVRELLMSAHQSPSGQEMLAEFSSTDRFDAIPADFLAAIDRIQASVVSLDQLVSEAETP